MARTRAATPPGVAEQRRLPRQSVAEMNAQDFDTIRERFLATRRDDRPAWVRVLDAIDAPRNQILSHLAPGLERKARESGDTAAFGTGRVNFSDVLGELGMKPGVIRAVLGFTGDLVFDPLTYVGAPGVGLRVANKAGQTVGIGLRGSRELLGGLGREGAIAAVKRGGLAAVKPGATRDLLEAAARTAAPGLENPALASHLSERVLGRVTSGRLGRAFSRVGGALEHEGGSLANYGEFGLAGQLDDEARAARAFVAQYGAGAGPGLRLGKGTTAVAHIPFTDVGLYVPALTDKAKYAADTLRVARQTGPVDPASAQGSGIAAVAANVQRVRDLERDIRAGMVPGTPADWKAEFDALAQEREHLIHGTAEAPRAIAAATPRSIGEMLSLKKLVREAEDRADLAFTRATAPSNPIPSVSAAVADAEQSLADAVGGAVKNYAQTQDPQTVRIARRFIGTDDDIMGSSVLASVARAATKFNDDGVTAEIFRRADAGVKQTFGQPGGMVRAMLRKYNNTMTTGAREVYTSLEREVRSKVLDAMEAAGLDRTVADYQKAAALVTAHMAVARNEADIAAGGLGKFFLEDVDGKPAQWVQDIADAQKSGYFSKAQNGSLNDRLKAVALENNRLLDSLGSQELTDELIGRSLEGYVPNSALPGARARMAAQKQYRLKSGGSASGKAGQATQEFFQKERSTTQYRFIDEAGQKQRFFEGDRWVQDYGPGDIAELSKEAPDLAKWIEDTKAAIGEYDARAASDEKFAAQFAPRNTHPAEMNELARSGRWSLLLGSDPIPGGDFMDTNVGTMMAARAMAHETAVARKDWLNFAKQFGVAVDPSLQAHAAKDGTFVLKDGTIARKWRDPKSQVYGIEMLGQRYRPLSDSFAQKGNPILEGIGDTKANIYHEDIARLIEESAKVYDQQGPELLKFLDAATAAWKTQSLMHPSWTVANLVGDTINYLTGGVRLQDLARQTGPMAQIFRNLDDPEALRGITVNIRGVPVSGEQFVNDLRAQRLIGNNRMAETVLQLLNRKFFYLPSQIQQGKTGIAGMMQALSPTTLKGDFLQRLEHTVAANKTLAGAKAAGFVARDRFVRGVIAPWFRANEVMQDYMRAMAYTSFLEQGHDIPMAVRKTINAGFDYADLTRVERNVFRRIFPFYAWMKNNGAYQLKLLMDRPIYTGMYPLLLNAAEEAINGDQQIPLHARPNWMRNQLALMVGKDDNRQAVMLGSGLPVEQAIVALEPLLGGPDGVQDFLKYFATGTNTILRSPVEIGVGREFFTDRTIGRGGDIGTGEYVANQFRPYREAGKIGETLSKQGPAQAAARLLLGGRIQSADNERLRVSKVREYKQEEESIRRQIATAGYRGDAGASVRARVRQLKLYDAMLKAGFADEVPKWAQAQLGQLAG